MSTLFDLSQEFNTLYAMLEIDEYDEETGEVVDNSEAINQLFEEMNMKLSEKLDNSQRYIIECNSKEEALKKEAKRLTDKANAIKNRGLRVKELMLAAIKATGETKLKSEYYSFSIKHTKSVAVNDVDDLPRQYVKLTRTPNKTEIKKALENGEEVPGCYIAENETLGVR